MLIKDFFQAFTVGKELANGATWKNAQLLGSKLAIFLGALLPILNAFGFLPELTVQDTATIAGGIVIIVGLFNGTATVVSTTKIGLRGLPASRPDSGRGEPVAEPTPADVPIPVERASGPHPVDPKPVEPDLFHNRSLG
jgi:hypothetical protein